MTTDSKGIKSYDKCIGYSFEYLDSSRMDGLYTIALTFMCFVFIVLCLRQSWPRSDIPGPSTWPLIGNLITAHEFISTPKRIKFVKEMTKLYGPIFRLFVGSYPIVVVQGYKNVMEVLQRRGKDFMDRPNWITGIRLARMKYGDFGVTLLNGDDWKSKRRFIHKAFKDLGVGKSSNEEKILTEVGYLIDYLEQMRGEEIQNIKDVMMKANCNIIHNVVFGYRYELRSADLQTLIDTLNVLFAGPVPLLSVTLIYPVLVLFFNDKVFKRRRASETLRTYIANQILEHQKSFDPCRVGDLVDVYLESLQGQKLEDRILRAVTNEILEFFTAGTDTTAATLDWCILYMIQYPDIQAKCHKEIDMITDKSRMVTYSDKRSLTYVEATLFEVQRLANPTFFSLPHAAVCDTTIAGYAVPKRTIILASLISAHLDKTIWAEPEKFNPSRFIGENNEIVNKDYLIPFSTGPRMCVGESLARMEIFLIFANILRKFEFSKYDPDDVLSFDGCDGITRTAMPYRVKITPR